MADGREHNRNATEAPYNHQKHSTKHYIRGTVAPYMYLHRLLKEVQIQYIWGLWGGGAKQEEGFDLASHFLPALFSGSSIYLQAGSTSQEFEQ